MKTYLVAIFLLTVSSFALAQSDYQVALSLVGSNNSLNSTVLPNIGFDFIPFFGGGNIHLASWYAYDSHYYDGNNVNSTLIFAAPIGIGLPLGHNISSAFTIGYAFTAYVNDSTMGPSGFCYGVNLSYHPFVIKSKILIDKKVQESRLGFSFSYKSFIKLPVNIVSLGVSFKLMEVSLDETNTNYIPYKNIQPSYDTTFVKTETKRKDSIIVSNIQPLKNSEKSQIEVQQNIVKVKGIVLDEKKNPIRVKIISEDLSNHKILDSTYSSNEDGSYVLNFLYGKFYGYYFDKIGFYPKSKNIDLRSIKDSTQTEVNDGTIELTSIKEMIKSEASIRVNNIFFDYNKTELKQESFSELDRLAKFLLENTDIVIEISGHTDNIGTDVFNNKLSKERALEVVKYLIYKGCLQKNIKVMGYGKSQPVSDNSTETGRQLNRRVEFKIVK